MEDFLMEILELTEEGQKLLRARNQSLEPILYEYLILDEMDILTLSQVLMNLPTPWMEADYGPTIAGDQKHIWGNILPIPCMKYGFSDSLRSCILKNLVLELKNILTLGLGQWDELMTYPFPFKFLQEYLDNQSEMTFSKHWSEMWCFKFFCFRYLVCSRLFWCEIMPILWVIFCFFEY